MKQKRALDYTYGLLSLLLISALNKNISCFAARDGLAGNTRLGIVRKRCLSRAVEKDKLYFRKQSQTKYLKFVFFVKLLMSDILPVEVGVGAFKNRERLA